MKKRKRSAFELLWISGIPWYLVAVFVGIKIAEALAEQRGEVFIVQSFEDLKNILLFALVFWLYVVVMKHSGRILTRRLDRSRGWRSMITNRQA